MGTDFTRTVKTFSATAYKTVIKDGQGIAEPIATVTYSASSENENSARKAFKAQGIKVPRGSAIDIKCIGTRKFAMSVDEFMAHAHEVEA